MEYANVLEIVFGLIVLFIINFIYNNCTMSYNNVIVIKIIFCLIKKREIMLSGIQ